MRRRSPSELSRRAFLAALPAAAALLSCRGQSPGSPLVDVPQTSAVGLFAAPHYGVDLADVIFRGLLELGPSVRGRRVFLKPNLVEYGRDTAINTHPAVVAGAAAAFLRAGASEVKVGEGPGHRRDIEYLLGASGLRECLADARLSFVDLNHDDVHRTRLRTRFMGFDELLLPVTLLQSDFVVSLPKLKTHHWAGMTAGMKNLFGVVPGAVYGWPKNVLHVAGIDNAILDLVATVRPQFTIVDGIVAMEGDGPIMGRPRPLGIVAMGADPVAVDATCARTIGLDPGKIPYLARASGVLGNGDERRIEQRGEKLSRYRTRFEVIARLNHLRLDG